MAKKRIGYGDLFCVFCGDSIEKKAERCPRCGKPYGDEKFCGIDVVGAGGLGWSDRAADPCFKHNNKKRLFGTFIIMLIVSAIIFAAIYFSGDMEISEMLPIFGIVMAIIWAFWIIWLIVQYGKRKDWEGVVEKKEKKLQEYTRKDAEGYRYKETRMVYKVHFRRNDGKIKTLTSINNSAWYEYLAEGDRVRYHGKNMNYYEKFDKTRDAMIPCASCGGLRDSRENYCGKCGAVILKGKPVTVSNIANSAAFNQRSENATKVKFCQNCGAKLADGSKFCNECGNRIDY